MTSHWNAINENPARSLKRGECLLVERDSLECFYLCKQYVISFSREEEGIELQVLSSDKKRDIQQNENNSSFGSIEFADFNSTTVKDEEQTVLSTIGM